MENYMNNYDSFNESIVYDFRITHGGLGDCIKFFMGTLKFCMENNKRLYYKKNNILIEKYIKLKYDKMYISEDKLHTIGYYTIQYPEHYPEWLNYKNDEIENIKDIFYFTDEVKLNCNNLLPFEMTNYISIHLRLGDKYLETDPTYICSKNDTRNFTNEDIYKFIEENYEKNIFFCCDNKNYKLKLKEKYDKIIITYCDIGHTSFLNTTEKQVLDGITEFYILTNSELIFNASYSGFSIIAAKFNNVPIINYYNLI
jgi:hypothetical protein